MRLSQLLPACLLLLSAFAAQKPSGERFEDFHRQTLSSTPLKLDDTTFSELTATPRDYFSMVLLTAMDARFGCQMCRELQPEWDLLARSWSKGDMKGETRLLFGVLDFLDGKSTFQSLMLQTAPVVFLYSPTIGPNAKPDMQPARLELTNGVLDAEAVHAWLSRHLPEGRKPPISRPINYVKFVTVTTAVLGALTFFTVAAPYILPVIQNRNLWAAISLVAVLLFTSGHMFNHIRKVPYVSGDGKGGISYFAGEFSNQFGLETQIVAVIYGVLSFAAISLALSVPRIADPKIQQFACFVWGGVILAVYSFLLSVFRAKNGGYPFWLPPF